MPHTSNYGLPTVSRQKKAAPPLAEPPAAEGIEDMLKSLAQFSVRTPHDDLKGFEVAMLEDIAGHAGREQGAKQVFADALSGIDPATGRANFTQNALDEIEITEEDLARAEIESKPSPFDNLDAFDVHLYNSIGKSRRRKQDEGLVAENAMAGLSVEEGRQALVEKELADVLGPDQNATPDNWLFTAMADYGQANPGVWSGTAGRPSDPGVVGPQIDGVEPPLPGGQGSAISDDGTVDLGEYGRLLQFLQTRPKPPEFAELQDPSTLSLIVAGILALNAPPEHKLAIMSAPLQYKQFEQATENQRREIEFQQMEGSFDAEMQDRLRLFGLNENAENAQRDDLRAAEIARFNAENAQRDDLRADERLSLDRDELDQVKVRDANRRLSATEVAQRAWMAEARRIATARNINAAMVPSLVRELNTLAGHEVFGEDPESLKMLTKLILEDRDIENRGLESRTRLTNVSADLKEIELRVKRETIPTAIATIRKNFELLGTNVEIKGLQLEQLAFVIANMDEVHREKMANMAARTTALSNANLEFEQRGSISDAEEFVLKRELGFLDDDIDGMVKIRDGYRKKADEHRATYLDLFDQKKKFGPRHPDTRFANDEWQRYDGLVEDLDKEIERARQESLEMAGRLKGGFVPVDPLTGDINQAGIDIGGGR